MEIGFRINLYRNTGKIETTQDTTQGTTQDTTQGISNVDRCKLTNADKEILNLIKEQSDITQKEIAAKLGWKVDRVKYYLNKMKRQDIVQRIGTSQKGYWKLLIEYDFLSR